MSRAFRTLLVLIAAAVLVIAFTADGEPETVKVRVSKELGNPAETGW